MSTAKFVPEIVVGIDFGMTCTGVAYSMGPEWLTPTTIQHWPGRLGYENRNKVDTVLAYGSVTGDPMTWGFLVNNDREDLEIHELFKLWLDPEHQDEARHGVTIQEARTWFVDYMHCIYEAILVHFDDSYPRWRSKQVEFLFSVPTTWKNPATIANTERLLRKAGFGARPDHVARISLTEAEAAAVYVSKQSYRTGDVLLVCDAGGGTTDINALKVKDNRILRTELESLCSVQGEAVGSTLIDFKVEQIVAERLKRISTHLSEDYERVAMKMMSDRFQTFKCSFGSSAQGVLDLLLPVPGLPAGQNFPAARIRDSTMVITRDEIQEVFDEMIGRVFELIDGEIRKLQTSHPGDNISYLVVSGGFGSSPYLKQRLRRRYELNGNDELFNARSVKILSVKEPQLAVCHGLIINRIQELKAGVGVYTERCCRNSYGIVVRQVYDPSLHQGEEVRLDARDKQKWAERQIHWLITQGQRVSVNDGIKHTYYLKINRGAEQLPWSTHIVMSSMPAEQLPKSMKHEGVKPLCVLESCIDKRSIKLKNRHWYNVGKQYFRAQFDMKVIVGPADMRFEVWTKEGQISKAHEEIEVIWDPLILESEGMETTQ